MIDNNLKALVIDEAAKLREHATESELNRINLQTFNPECKHTCIYGQMSGNCFSARAINLLKECAKPYSVDNQLTIEPCGNSFTYSEMRSFSPIEFYICQYGAKNATLIEYLRGERESITIEDL